MDGEITLGTRLDTDKFDRQITQLEKKMQKEENKKITIETEIQRIKETTDDFNNLIKEADEYKKKIEEINQINMKRHLAGQDLLPLTNEQQEMIELSNQMEQYISKNASGMQKLADKGNELIRKHQEINSSIAEYKQKIENVKIQKQVADVEKLKNSFNSVGSSIQKSITNVARLALGIFGIRSAYMALRRASSDLASYDQQYATNLEYIRYALTQAIAPVLQWIVNLAAKLLGYINAIMQAWFGINLFSRGSAENFNKMKAGASGASKAVKEIKKQLAGFDEINMLTDQSDSGAGGGGGAGGAMPDFDLSKMQGDPPKWLQWIIDHKDEILSVLAGIATALALIHLGVKPLTALGIGAMVTGLLLTIGAIKDYLEAPTWENFGKIIQGIGIFLTGLLGIILGFPRSYNWCICIYIRLVGTKLGKYKSRF